MVTKFWCKQLLMIKPDPAPYLLASRKPREVRLYAAFNEPLYWTNQAQIITDTLSGKSLGTSPFELVFQIHSNAITQGTTFLLDAPGLMKCWAQDDTLNFKFGWDASIYAINTQPLKTGWNTVVLSSTRDIITLQVNEYTATLFGGVVPFTKINFPAETESDTAYLNQILESGTWEVADGVLQNVKVSDSSGTAYGHMRFTTTNACTFLVDSTISSEANYDYGAVYIGTESYEPTQSQVKSGTTDGKGNYVFTGNGETITTTSPAKRVGNYCVLDLQANTEYVASFIYVKDGSGSRGDDKLKIHQYATTLDATPYPTITVGQLAVQTDWTKVKAVRASIL